MLVVDDERDMLETIQKMLSVESYQVDVSEDPEKAMQMYEENSYDLVIVDLKMPKIDGMQFMEKVHDINREQLVLVITAYASAENAMRAVRSGAFDFIRKPFRIDELSVVVGRALRFKDLQDENIQLQRSLHESFESRRIVGRSQALKEALVRLQKVSEVDVSVLIAGESGTGKELFARTLHENSPRKEDPFLAVDCAALPETLLESELFGYEKGAFTGAIQQKKGLLESARGGTVLLDEIGEMSSGLQAKLLRCLQEQKVRRLGGDQECPVDVRILAATNRDLEKMIREGSFREDLYYRINVVEIQIPPLRERQGDIPLLAKHFFDQFKSNTPKRIEGIASAVLLIMEKYHWPGNVRELRNVVERACTLSESAQIMPEDLPSTILEMVEQTAEADSGHFQQAKKALIEDFERSYVVQMLSRTEGNVTEAAHFSGLSRTAFHRLMNKHGLHSTDFKEVSQTEDIQTGNS